MNFNLMIALSRCSISLVGFCTFSCADENRIRRSSSKRRDYKHFSVTANLFGVHLNVSISSTCILSDLCNVLIPITIWGWGHEAWRTVMAHAISNVNDIHNTSHYEQRHALIPTASSINFTPNRFGVPIVT